MNLRQYYDQMAAQQQAHYQSSGWLNRVLVQERVAQFNGKMAAHALKGMHTVWDIGCGDGKPLLDAMEQHPIKQVYLLDGSDNMLTIATGQFSKRFPAVALETFGLELPTWDPNGMPKAEVVLCLGVLNHVQEYWRQVLQGFSELATKRIVLAYCPTSFWLAGLPGKEFRKRGLPFQAIDPKAVKQQLEDKGWNLVKGDYLFGWKGLSPYGGWVFEK